MVPGPCFWVGCELSLQLCACLGCEPFRVYPGRLRSGAWEEEAHIVPCWLLLELPCPAPRPRLVVEARGWHG